MSTRHAIAVGPITDLTPGEGRAYVVEGQQIAVFLLPDGTVRATAAVCPHRGGPLADGQIDNTVVMCPLHQYGFSLATGECTAGDVPPVTVHHAEVRDGTILVTV
ncbi:Rieske (2Fe-2S) protein [Lolliginicoccus suaedae]|uniref:Rieske (2Fe-2S) protein n=1 Tax=Lolliginicoccus suaedae TaxID=2605429 RepID=UPI0011ECE420|nr:Rieske 2Fe-2S domain-containing protein [Lolliginicoccus suaedae]